MTRSVRYIGKCGACKATTARDYTETQQATKGAGMYRRTVAIYGRTIDGVFVRAAHDFRCAACGERQWNGKRVEGFTTDHKCDARCTEAKGFRCECSCGGENHGRRFLVCEAA